MKFLSAWGKSFRRDMKLRNKLTALGLFIVLAGLVLAFFGGAVRGSAGNILMIIGIAIAAVGASLIYFPF